MKKGEHKGRPAPGDRGLYDFAVIRECYGGTLTVRQSSGVGEPRVWLFTSNAEGEDGVFHLGAWQAHHPLLGVREATILRDALDRFIGEAAK